MPYEQHISWNENSVQHGTCLTLINCICSFYLICGQTAGAKVFSGNMAMPQLCWTSCHDSRFCSRQLAWQDATEQWQNWCAMTACLRSNSEPLCRKSAHLTSSMSSCHIPGNSFYKQVSKCQCQSYMVRHCQKSAYCHADCMSAAGQNTRMPDGLCKVMHCPASGIMTYHTWCLRL